MTMRGIAMGLLLAWVNLAFLAGCHCYPVALTSDIVSYSTYDRQEFLAEISSVQGSKDFVIADFGILHISTQMRKARRLSDKCSH